MHIAYIISFDLGVNMTFLNSFVRFSRFCYVLYSSSLAHFHFSPLFLYAYYSVSVCCVISIMMEVSLVFLIQSRGNSWDFQRGCGCVLCLVWSRGPTALALILWRPSLPQRAELLIKKPSAQTEPFHLELWHPWHSLCLFIAVLLAARSQFCLKSYLDFFWSVQWTSFIDAVWISLCEIWI